MEAKYKEFLAYNFGENEQFRRYIDAIEPPAPLAKIPFYKKKFYKLRVDPEFDINYNPENPQPEEKKAESEESKAKPASDDLPSGEPQSRPQEEQKTASQPQMMQKSLPWATKLQMMLFFVFLCTFPLGFIARSYYQGIPLILGFIVALVKKYGMPKFNRHYWQGLFMDDHFHNMVSVIVCIISASSTIIIWFPIILRVVIFLAECVSLMAKYGSKLAQITNKVTGKVAEQRDRLLTFKADLEIYAGFYLVLALLMGWVSLILPLFYWQIMQVKYMLNGYSRIALDKLASQMDGISSHPSCPFPLRWLLQGLRKLGAYMVKMTQPEAPQPQAPTH